MDEKILKWLYDIKLAIEEIDSLITEKQISFFTKEIQCSKELLSVT